jgi:hypothetical protein
MTTKGFINRIGDLIGKDDIKTAISEIRNLLQKCKHLDEIIIHSARYNDLMKQIRLGIITSEEADITKNKIRYAVLDIVREIEENIEQNQELEQETDNILGQIHKFSIQNISNIGNNSNNNITVQDISTQNGNITIGK